MAEDWLADVRKYASDADESVVGAIVKYLGIALQGRDSSLVSFSDPQEVGRVRERFLQKKLALTAPVDALDQGLDWVKGVMTGDRTKNRVTVYYLLAHYFGKLDLFGGAAGTSAASLAGGGSVAAASLAGLGAAGVAATAGAAETPPHPPRVVPPARVVADPVRSVPEPSAVASSPLAAPPTHGPAAEVSGEPRKPAYAAELNGGERESSGWPRWLTWLLIALAVVALVLLLQTCMADRSVTSDETSTSEAVPPAVSEAVVMPSGTADTPASAVPAGAGVVSAVRDSKPLLTVYFEIGQSAVSNDLAAASGNVKAYLDAHAGSKVAVSGYNDPSGNAALNAALSKKRAQAVSAALATAGIPQGSIELVKPTNTTSATVTPEQARRVEVSIQ